MTTSYLSESLGFKVKKVIRYISLFGVSKTLVKVRGQFHMESTIDFDGKIWENPAASKTEHLDRFVAIIGCGNFAYSHIAYCLSKKKRNFLRATYDVNTSRAISLCRQYRGAYATTEVQKIIDDPSVRLVYIASNHASHTEYAIQCLRAGKHVHIEKPHVVSDDQLGRLLIAQKTNPDSMIFLGFNRPKSRHFKKVRTALDSQSGPIMINWFIAGHEIPDDHWYFKKEEGGRVLGNLCHWTDLTLEIVGVENAFPCDVIPASHHGSKSDFCIGIRFADGSVAGITFSAKGHTFEGVREVLQAHRGDVLVRLEDFKETFIEIVEKRQGLKTFYRDHGHAANIMNSYDSVAQNRTDNATNARYLEATSQLFLAVKRALDSQETVQVTLSEIA